MYIEVLHDEGGTIVGCTCADTLPKKSSSPYVTYSDMPKNTRLARVNIDTIEAMRIEANTGNQIVDGEIKDVDRSDYIRANFKINIEVDVPIPEEITLPEGMKFRGLTHA